MTFRTEMRGLETLAHFTGHPVTFSNERQKMGRNSTCASTGQLRKLMRLTMLPERRPLEIALWRERWSASSMTKSTCADRGGCGGCGGSGRGEVTLGAPPQLWGPPASVPPLLPDQLLPASASVLISQSLTLFFPMHSAYPNFYLVLFVASVLH